MCMRSLYMPHLAQKGMARLQGALVDPRLAEEPPLLRPGRATWRTNSRTSLRWLNRCASAVVAHRAAAPLLPRRPEKPLPLLMRWPQLRCSLLAVCPCSLLMRTLRVPSLVCCLLNSWQRSLHRGAT